MIKNCTTCKYEHDWDKYNNGICKKIPKCFIADNWSRKSNGDIIYYSNIIESGDCTLWDAKQ